MSATWLADGVTDVIQELEAASWPPLAYRIASYWLPSWPDRRPTCCPATATARKPSGPLISKKQMPAPNTVRAEGQQLTPVVCSSRPWQAPVLPSAARGRSRTTQIQDSS